MTKAAPAFMVPTERLSATTSMIWTMKRPKTSHGLLAMLIRRIRSRLSQVETSAVTSMPRVMMA